MNPNITENTPRRQTTEFLDHDTGIALYRGNPCIGALGSIVDSDEEVIKKLTPKVPYEPIERTAPARKRLHSVQALSLFNMPTPQQVAVFNEIERKIRVGYLHRNPFDPKYRAICLEDRERLERGELPIQRYDSLDPQGICVAGASGGGKTPSVNLGLAHYPYAISHFYEIDRVICAFVQIPWVKVDLPANASMKEFGVALIETIDALGRSDLMTAWNIRACNETTIGGKIYAACRKFSVGMIVVDEAQNMSRHRKGTEHFIAYLVDLMNTLGIPIVLIGTESLVVQLQSSRPAGRRFVSSVPIFTPFEKGSKLWNEFDSRLWSYLYIKGTASFDQRSDLMHDLTGGVPDFAVKLAILTQTRLFGRTDKDGKEAESVGPDELTATRDLLFHLIAGGGAAAGAKSQLASEGVWDSWDAKMKEWLNAFAARKGAPPVFPAFSPQIDAASENAPKTAPVAEKGDSASARSRKRPPEKRSTPAGITARLQARGLLGGTP